MRHRRGLTLVELLVTVTLVATLLYLGGSSLRIDETEATRDAAYDVVEAFRRARYVAARQNTAVVVSVTEYGGTLPSGDVTRGLIEARAAGTTTCPGTVPAGDPFVSVDFGTYSGSDESVDPGLVIVTPAELEPQGFCIRPNGRILNNTTSQPIRPSGEVTVDDLAGYARVWVQYEPLVGGRNVDAEGVPAIPRMQVEIPFNGLVRVPQ